MGIYDKTRELIEKFAVEILGDQMEVSNWELNGTKLTIKYTTKSQWGEETFYHSKTYDADILDYISFVHMQKV